MTDAASHVPHPLRFWWLKRIALSLLVFVVVLAALRLVWGWRMQREFDALIASYRAKGEPTTAADFAEEPVADEENAVPLLRQAAASVTTAQAIWDADHRNAYVGRSIAEPDLRLLRQHVVANATALPVARRARQRPRVYWDLPLVAPYVPRAPTGGEPGQQYVLGSLLRYAALVAHTAGDDAAAIEYLRDAFFVARALAQHPDGSFHSIAGIITERTVTAVFQIAPTLEIAHAAPPGSWRLPASRRQIDALIREHLEDANSNAAVLRLLKAERLHFTDFRDQVMGWELRGAVVPLVGRDRALPVSEAIEPFVRPAMYRHAIDRLRHIDALVRAVDASDWHVARAGIAREASHALPDAAFPRRVPITGVRTADFMNRSDSGESSRLARYRYRAAKLRFAATRLAIRAYEVDHAGALPPSLAALVPRYLPQVPIDPFGDGVATLRYSPDGRWPHLSGAGPGGANEVALGRIPPDEGAVTFDVWQLSDFVFLLRDRPQPTTAPATLPVEKQ